MRFRGKNAVEPLPLHHGDLNQPQRSSSPSLRLRLEPDLSTYEPQLVGSELSVPALGAREAEKEPGS